MSPRPDRLTAMMPITQLGRRFFSTQRRVWLAATADAGSQSATTQAVWHSDRKARVVSSSCEPASTNTWLAILRASPTMRLAYCDAAEVSLQGATRHGDRGS